MNSTKAPIDVPTRSTAAFIAAHVRSGAKLIEVGCGEGYVARALVERGNRVLAIDSDPEAVAKARQLGLTAAVASWPEFESGPVDAVVFTRSLHHIHELEPAVQRARTLLRPEGVLLVEDFAYDEADAATVDWFLKVLRSPAVRAQLDPKRDQFIADLLASTEPLVTWQENHDHDLHKLPAMTRALTQHFDHVRVDSVPYVYRYVVPALPDSEEAAAVTEHIFREEDQCGTRGEIVLLGRRIVAS